jgi:hypothetical protein
MCDRLWLHLFGFGFSFERYLVELGRILEHLLLDP